MTAMRNAAVEVEKLNAKFAKDAKGAARFEVGHGDFTRLVLSVPTAEAHVYLYGAHVTHYQPRGQSPVLFLSEKSHFTHGRPIRGGVPIVFPWFGPRASDPQAPLHGFARISDWDVESITSHGESVTAVLTLGSSEVTHAVWPHDFQLRYTITVGAELDLTLAVTNPLSDPITFEEALHTYFAVGDVRRTRIRGLTGTAYLDKNRDMAKLVDSDDPLVLTEASDRVYLGTKAACIIDDPAAKRRITADKEGSETTIVWNPWSNPPKPMADLGEDEWPKFVCVETANAKDYVVTLGAEATHTMRSIIRAERA